MENKDNLYQRAEKIQETCQRISKIKYLFLMMIIQSIIFIIIMPSTNKVQKIISIFFILVMLSITLWNLVYVFKNRKHIKSINLFKKATSFKSEEIFNLLNRVMKAINIKDTRIKHNITIYDTPEDYFKNNVDIKIKNEKDINEIINLISGIEGR